MPHPLRIDETFKKRLGKKPHAQQGAIYECIARLSDDPTHPGLHSESVRGCPGVFSARVDRANRLTFEWDEGVIVLRNHCNHDAVYRRP